VGDITEINSFLREID